MSNLVTKILKEASNIKPIDISKLTYLYHATSEKNLTSILDTGLKEGIEGVYMSDTPQNALKFLFFRNELEFITIPIFIKKLDPNKLHESFDHSLDFFKCQAWVYDGDIPLNCIDIAKINLLKRFGN